MIETLTKAQEDAIIPFREKWIARILRTEQSDEEIKNNVASIYTLSGLEQPKQVWIMDSMFGVQVAINWLKNTKDVKLNMSNIRSNIWSNIWSNIEDNIRSNIRSNIGSNIEDNIEDNIRSNIGSNIRSNIWSNKLEWFGFSDNESTYLQWYLYQKYYFDNGLLMPDKYSELLNSYIEMAIDAWAVYYSKDIAIVSRKPQIKRNADGLLHSTNSPAVSFKDGYDIYYINGINFPKELFDKVTSGSMPFEEILAIVDVDQRNQAMRFVGLEEKEKWLKHVKAEVIDEYKKISINGNEIIYKLYKIPQGEVFTEDTYIAYYTCPSTGLINFSAGEQSLRTIPEVMAWKMSDEVNIITPEDWKLLVPLVDES